MSHLVDVLNGVVWSNALIVVIVGAGLYFTVRLGVPQVRHFVTMFRELKESTHSRGGVSSFAALMMSLSARLGTGNIAGVATAVAMGGPGAVFWMWVTAVVGMATAFCEGVLAQLYKQKDGDQFRGGPALYLAKGTGWKPFGIIYAVLITIAYSVFLPGTQSNSIALTFKAAWGVPPIWAMVGVVALLLVIALGGVKRFAAFSKAVVPFAAGLYLLLALVVIAANASQIPGMFSLIFSSAFGGHAIFGGLLGSAIMMGVKRGLYSNEAGQGTAAHAAATANPTHPARQGFVQSFGVFFDTIIICTITAFMMLITNCFNVYDKANNAIVDNLPGVEPGASYPQAAVDSLMPSLGATIMAVIVFFFAFTTLQYYQFASEMNLKELLPGNKIALWALRIIVLAAALYGGLTEATTVWAIGDLGIGIMTWCNIVGLVILVPIVAKVMKDYERQHKAGIANPTFDPLALGIKRADYWEGEVSTTTA
jgi:AGCS family alanine or glycine:cation symporter